MPWATRLSTSGTPANTAAARAFTPAVSLGIVGSTVTPFTLISRPSVVNVAGERIGAPSQ